MTSKRSWLITSLGGVLWLGLLAASPPPAARAVKEAGRSDDNLVPASVAITPTQKTVLVLSPFQLDLSTNLIAAQALREEFGPATDLSLDVYYEYLDLNRFPTAADQAKIFDLLTAKYKSKAVDLVIVSSEAMLKLWLAQRAEILPKTPIVFFDVTTEHLAALNLPPNVTGVSGVEDCETSVRWVLGAMPAVTEIVLVMGAGKIEQGFFDHIQKVQADLKGQVKFTDLAGRPVAEIKQHLAQLPPTSIVLYHPLFEDAAGQKYRPLDVLRELTAVSTVPVIGGYDQFIGTGLIGGYMYSIDQQARDAAQISLRVLRGELVSAISIEENQSDRFIFDHLALQRWGLPLAVLPPDSLIKNRQYSTWEVYQGQIIAAAITMTILLILVVVLTIVTRRLNTARLALSRLNVNLETQVQERTAALSQTNQTLELEITGRNRVEAALRESEARFRSYFELPLTGRAITSPDKGWIDVNATLCEMLGYTKAELMQLTWAELTHPDDIAADLVQFNRVLADEIGGYDFRETLSPQRRPHRSILNSSVQCQRRPDRSIDYFVALIQDITERRQAEEALRESETKYRLSESELRRAQSVAHLGNWKWDLRTKEVIWSDEMYRIFGIDKSSYTERLGGAIQKVIHPDDLHLVLPSNAAAFMDNRPVEYRIRWPDGSIRHIWAVSGETTVDADGRPIFLTGIAQDITERKQAEEALRQTNAYLENLINYANAPIIVWDPHFHITRFNHAFEFLTGRTEAEVVGQSLEILFPPELANQSMALIRKTLTGERWETVEIKIQHRDGTVRTVLWNSATIFAADGHTPQATIAQGQDITERKRTEEELRQNEEEHRSLLDSQEGNILVLDFDGVHHYVNQVGAASITGAGTAQDILGKRLHDLYPEPTANWQLAQIRQVITTGQGLSGEYEHVEDNQSQWWHLNLQPIRNAAGQVVQVMVNSLNITERKRMEVALRESEERIATILRLSPIVIGVSTAAEGRYTDVNDAFEHVLGYSQAETIGHTSFDLNLWVGDDTRANILRDIQARGRVENLEIRIRRKSGEVFPALIFITPIVLHDTPLPAHHDDGHHRAQTRRRHPP